MCFNLKCKFVNFMRVYLKRMSLAKGLFLTPCSQLHFLSNPLPPMPFTRKWQIVEWVRQIIFLELAAETNHVMWKEEENGRNYSFNNGIQQKQTFLNYKKYGYCLLENCMLSQCSTYKLLLTRGTTQVILFLIFMKCCGCKDEF